MGEWPTHLSARGRVLPAREEHRSDRTVASLRWSGETRRGIDERLRKPWPRMFGTTSSPRGTVNIVAQSRRQHAIGNEHGIRRVDDNPEPGTPAEAAPRTTRASPLLTPPRTTGQEWEASGFIPSNAAVRPWAPGAINYFPRRLPFDAHSFSMRGSVPEWLPVFRRSRPGQDVQRSHQGLRDGEGHLHEIGGRRAALPARAARSWPGASSSPTCGPSLRRKTAEEKDNISGCFADGSSRSERIAATELGGWNGQAVDGAKSEGDLAFSARVHM